MNKVDAAYSNLLADILLYGDTKEGRNGITKSLTCQRLEVDSLDGFPILTGKRVFFKGVVGELLWFLRGETNIKYLLDNGIHIWDEWADSNGSVGPIYGSQWTNWQDANGSGINQISNLIQSIRDEPNSRRHIVTAWNPAELDAMALPPCHMFFQVLINKPYMDLHVYQRSADMFLGVPFNISSYALLQHLLCHHTGYFPRKLVFSYGDCHVYGNHKDAVSKYIGNPTYKLPELKIKPRASIFNHSIDDFSLSNYVSSGRIRAPVSK